MKFACSHVCSGFVLRPCHLGRDVPEDAGPATVHSPSVHRFLSWYPADSTEWGKRSKLLPDTRLTCQQQAALNFYFMGMET